MSYTIKEASELIGLPASTIRYYDKHGLIQSIERSDSGYRKFSDGDIELLRIIECLKRTGMAIKEIKQFALWIRQGDASLEQRYGMFLERRKAVQAQMKELQEIMKLIEYKCRYYEIAIKAGTEAVHRNNEK